MYMKNVRQKFNDIEKTLEKNQEEERMRKLRGGDALHMKKEVN